MLPSSNSAETALETGWDVHYCAEQLKREAVGVVNFLHRTTNTSLQGNNNDKSSCYYYYYCGSQLIGRYSHKRFEYSSALALSVIQAPAE
jgi:hypothetical protein